MSITVLKRRKDGTIRPVTVSIWDAFKGVPKPKLRLTHWCETCGKLHDPARHPAVNVQAAAPATTETAAAAADPKPNSAPNADQTPPPPPAAAAAASTPDWTAEQDTLLTQLKESNTPWKSIVEILENGKTTQQVKERWREIDPSRTKPATTQKEAGEEKKGDKSTATASDKEKKEAEKKKEEEEGEQVSGSSSKNKDVGMKEWAEKYDSRKWRVAASKYFDRTGRRITAEQARKMAVG